MDLAVGAADQVPVAVRFHGAQEIVLDRHGIVGILARNGQIGFRIPVGVIGVELDFGIALLGELHDALDIAVGHHHAAGLLDLTLQSGVLFGVEAGIIGPVAIDAGLHDGLQMLLAQFGTGHEGGNLLLLAHFPVDIGFDIGMVGIHHHHFGGAAGCAARLDGARCTVADLQKAHQARRAAATGQLFAFAAQHREVGAGARTIFEQAGFTHPQVHDAAFVDQIVGHALNEAGMRLGMLVGGFRLDQLAGLEIDIIMALRRTVDAIGPMQAGVEPLRGIGRAHLHRQHETVLVVEGLCIFLGGEMATLPAPIGPAACKAVKYLLCAHF